MKHYYGVKEKNLAVAKYIIILYYTTLPGQHVGKHLLLGILQFCVKEALSVHIFPYYSFFTPPSHGFLPTEENLPIREKDRLLKKIAGLCTIFLFEIFLWLLKVKAVRTETNLISLMREWSSIELNRVFANELQCQHRSAI